jgi:hypothetical protein
MMRSDLVQRLSAPPARVPAVLSKPTQVINLSDASDLNTLRLFAVSYVHQALPFAPPGVEALAQQLLQNFIKTEASWTPADSAIWKTIGSQPYWTQPVGSSTQPTWLGACGVVQFVKSQGGFNLGSTSISPGAQDYRFHYFDNWLTGCTDRSSVLVVTSHIAPVPPSGPSPFGPSGMPTGTVLPSGMPGIAPIPYVAQVGPPAVMTPPQPPQPIPFGPPQEQPPVQTKNVNVPAEQPPIATKNVNLPCACRALIHTKLKDGQVILPDQGGTAAFASRTLEIGTMGRLEPFLYGGKIYIRTFRPDNSFENGDQSEIAVLIM